jgi:hypothetical protein
MELEEEEVAEFEAAIRDILVLTGLQWILDDVDEAIRTGMWTERPVVMRHQRRRTPTGYEQIDFFELPDPLIKNQSNSTITTSVPYSRRQRVAFLLSAIQRAVVELPTIQEETVKALNEIGNASHEDLINEVQVETVRFLPEAETTSTSAPPLLSELQEHNAVEHRESVVRVLSALLEELNL